MARGIPSTVAAVVFLMVLMVCASPCWCASFSPLILTSANVGQFEKMLKAAGEKSCVVVQVKPELFDEKKAKILMNWVSLGGTLWFYDSRLASYFGMKADPFEAKDFPYKKMEAEYGSEKNFSGIAVGCEAQATGTVTMGIRKVVTFVLEVEKNRFSAVRDGEGVTPFLKIMKSDSYCIAAMKVEGCGKVIFKPLLWEDQYDGRDFQRKLSEYSSKKSVPFFKGPEAEGKR
ncbi:MAG: hypothetical protein RDV48_22790 [Candidatus Eremiobacteraeota bacterium]|nr:hypothetical protein [Candidatus Eremiobacteraeota bacterium]